VWWEVESGMGWWMLWEGILFVLFWAAVIGLAAWAVSTWRPRDERVERTALDIAEERYARGDISREEFDQIRRDLQKGGVDHVRTRLCHAALPGRVRRKPGTQPTPESLHSDTGGRRRSNEYGTTARS